MRALVPFVLVVLLAPAASAQPAEPEACTTEVTLLGGDDLRWRREGDDPAAVNPRIAGLCAGVEATFTIVAEGQIPHNFVVEAPGAPPVTDVVVDGERTTYAWTPPEDAAFRYRCTIHGNQMTGTVLVGDSAAAAPPPPSPMPAHPVPMPPPQHAQPGWMHVAHALPLAGAFLGPLWWLAMLVMTVATGGW